MKALGSVPCKAITEFLLQFNAQRFKNGTTGSSFVSMRGGVFCWVSLADDTYTSQYSQTVGVDFQAKTITLPNKANIKLEIWDASGQQRYRRVNRAYVRIVNVICVVYDVTKSNSFKNMKEFNNFDVRNTEIIKFVVGNKNDKEDKREVTFDEGKKFADEQGYEFREVSAANGQGVNDLFLSIARAAYKEEHPESLTGWSSSATSFFKKK